MPFFSSTADELLGILLVQRKRGPRPKIGPPPSFSSADGVLLEQLMRFGALSIENVLRRAEKSRLSAAAAAQAAAVAARRDSVAGGGGRRGSVV